MKSIHDIDLVQLARKRSYHPSPVAWEDEIIYFLLVDRFADQQIGQTALYRQDQDYGNIFREPERLQAWHDAADQWNGGNLQGLISQLDYLRDLGITVIWINPILRQTAYDPSYHGYGIQNFLAIDPHFGDPEDLCRLVEAAHERGIYVILDVVINHAGNVFSYLDEAVPFRNEPYPVVGFHDAEGQPVISPDHPEPESFFPEGGVWPKELLNLETFSRKGAIIDWERYPDHVQGDFYSLKNICTGEGPLQAYRPSPALQALTRCYQYWMAYADLDGFRLDTVKHLDPGATRWFTRQIHEYARTLGKHNFYIIGEITGGTAFAMDLLRKTGLNAALGINEAHEKLESVAKGLADPDTYFALFRNSLLDDEEGDRWLRNNVIVMFDDHDMVAQIEYKRRFCADHWARPLLQNALFLNLFSLGIPCLYYGTEQGFDGEGGADKYIREAMFGGDFGPFRSHDRHCFDSSHPAYQALSRLATLRRQHMPLRYGRQYLRPFKSPEQGLIWPRKGAAERYTGIVAWSRILSDQEYLLAISCSLDKEGQVLTLVDRELNPEGRMFRCLISSDKDQIGRSEQVGVSGSDHVLRLTVPAAGYAIYVPDICYPESC